MHLTLEVKSQQELQLILKYLQLLPGVKVIAEPKNQSEAFSETPDLQKTKRDFSKYWGSIQTGLAVEDIDSKLNEIRREWDRDLS